MLVWWVASDLSLHPPPSPPCLPPVSVHLRLSVVSPANAVGIAGLGAWGGPRSSTTAHGILVHASPGVVPRVSMHARLQRRLARNCAAFKAGDP